MTVDINVALEAGAAVITAVGGLYTAGRRVIAHSKKKSEQYREGILKQANDEMGKVKTELTEKIKSIETELENHKVNISKDLGFLKQTYSTEIKNLGDKIETVREQLNTQHAQLVALLTRLIDTK